MLKNSALASLLIISSLNAASKRNQKTTSNSGIIKESTLLLQKRVYI